MNYEKIIVELLGRIQTLEDQISYLMGQQERNKKGEGKKMTTEEIRIYIDTLKAEAKKAGKDTLVLRCGTLHNDLGLKHRHPQVCDAMYDCMGSFDQILHTTPKGKSSTIEIEYKL